MESEHIIFPPVLWRAESAVDSAGKSAGSAFLICTKRVGSDSNKDSITALERISNFYSKN